MRTRLSKLLCFFAAVVGFGVEGKGNLRVNEEGDDVRLLVVSNNVTLTMNETMMNETLMPSFEASLDAAIVVEEEDEPGTSPPLVAPSNNECLTAEGPIPATTRSLDGSQEITVAGTTRGASKANLARCAGNTFTSPSVWYYTFGTGSVLTASTCWPGTDLDTKISVLESNCTQLECVGGNDDASSTVRGGCEVNKLASRVTWSTEVNQLYYLVVHAFSNKVGNFELNIDALNDQCDYAIALQPGDTIRGDTRGAMTPFDGKIDNCNKQGLLGEGPSLWYSINGTGMTLQATTCDDNDEDNDVQNFKIHVFENVCGVAKACIGGVAPTSLECSTYEWESEAGVTYYILLHASTSIFAGVFDLTVREVASVA